MQERRTLENGILIHVIDVGQGDCMVIETSDGNVMIDTGTNISESALRGYLRSRGLGHFDYLILSHPHDDHIGNADMILKEFHVDRLLCAETQSVEPVWQETLAALDAAQKTKSTEWIRPINGSVYWVGKLRIEILQVPEKENLGENDDSMIVRLDYGDCSMLLTGDAENKAEERLLAGVSSERLKADFLKVAHHGASGSTGETFLQAVSPAIAVISAGESNSFGHPHEELLNRLRTLNVDIYRTDINGTLVFYCDGQIISPRKLF